MVNRKWSFVAGLFLTAGCVTIGLWANLTLSGDPLAVAESTSSVVDATTILLTTLFIGLSGGHYIGASFDNDSSGRWFALGANSVLWLVLIGFISLRISGGGNVYEPTIYAAVLIFTGGGIFSLHKSAQVENGSKLADYIELFSSKGTALIVTVSFIVRTVPNTTIAAIAAVILVVVGGLLWNAYGEQFEENIHMIENTIADMASTDDSQQDKLK